MFEIRFHGRGGQGAVTAAELLALAAFLEGKEVQSFPEFGVERRGAPVKAFCRISDGKIIIHSNIYKPDCVVVFDFSLVKTVNVSDGLKKEGWLVLNTEQLPENFRHLGLFKIATIDATGIAIRHKLGSETSPIVNTTILGAIASIGVVKKDSLIKAMSEKIEKKFGDNAAACEDAYSETKIFTQEGENNERDRINSSHTR